MFSQAGLDGVCVMAGLGERRAACKVEPGLIPRRGSRVRPIFRAQTVYLLLKLLKSRFLDYVPLEALRPLLFVSSRPKQKPVLVQRPPRSPL
jgi:hypothetical protein